MDLEKIKAVLVNEPKYRQGQIDKLIFQDLISDWQEASVLPLSLRSTLNNEAPLSINAAKLISKDGQTEKALITLDDNLQIESVLMKYKDRSTVCVSSQIGCPLNCAFCATGKMGFKRNLATSEIVSQILFFARELKKEGKKITNIVYMGMGEPFLNYDNVLDSIKILNNQSKFGLGARHFSISTSGIIEGIEKFTDEKMEINLAISLHGPNNDLRSELMPTNKKYPLDDLMAAVNNYLKKTKRKVMFEYILLDKVNDGEKEASELAKLLRHPLYHLNLIQYNETGFFKPSTKEKTEKFKNILRKEGISFTERFRFGTEIKAACGQLIVNS